MNLPFKECMNTNISISQTGIREAIGLWRRLRNNEPDSLFVSSVRIEYARYILNEFPELPKLNIVAYDFYESSWWSVGRLGPDFGFGSTDGD